MLLSEKNREIKQRLHYIETHSLTPSQNSKYTIFSGNTGCGKSTLINYLMDVPLKQQKLKNGQYKIEKENRDIQSPQIGQQYESCTKETQDYQYKNNIYIDTPAAIKTQSNINDIETAVAQSNLYLQGRMIKYVFVSDIFEITVGRPIDFIRHIKHIITRFDIEILKEFFGSMLLVISKFNHKDDISQNDVLECIGEIAKVQQDQLVKNCLKFMLKANRILIFPVPSHPKFNNYISEIKNTLNNFPYTQLDADYPSYANEQGQYTLKKLIKDYEFQFADLCKQIRNKVKTNFAPASTKTNAQNFKSLLEAHELLGSPQLFQDTQKQQKLFRLLLVQRQGAEMIKILEDIQYFRKFVEYQQANYQQANYQQLQEIMMAVKNCKDRLEDQCQFNEQMAKIKKQHSQKMMLEQKKYEDSSQSDILEKRQPKKYKKQYQPQYNVPPFSNPSYTNSNYQIPQHYQNNHNNVYSHPNYNQNAYYTGYYDPYNPPTNRQQNKGFLRKIKDTVYEVYEALDDFFGSNHRGNRRQRNHPLANLSNNHLYCYQSQNLNNYNSIQNRNIPTNYGSQQYYNNNNTKQYNNARPENNIRPVNNPTGTRKINNSTVNQNTNNESKMQNNIKADLSKYKESNSRDPKVLMQEIKQLQDIKEFEEKRLQDIRNSMNR